MLARGIKFIGRKSGLYKVVYEIKKQHYINALPCTMRHEEAAAILHEFSPDPNTSCYEEKTISDLYDLDIIVPAYNVEKYIVECIDSLIHQITKFSYHIICVDGSTDQTGTLLSKYESIENITIIHQSNKGFSGARNTGLRMAQGKYIMFVDSDDSLPQGTIQKMLECAIKSGADIVEGAYINTFENGIKKKAYKHPSGVVLSWSKLNGYPWAKIYKKELFYNVVFPENYWYEDSAISQVVFPLAKSFYCIFDVVYKRRLRPSSIGRTGVRMPKAIDSFYINKKLFYERKKFGLKIDQEYYEYILRAVLLTYHRIAYMPDNIKKAVFVEWAYFLRHEMSEFATMYHQDLEYALNTYNYELYSAYCEMH